MNWKINTATVASIMAAMSLTISVLTYYRNSEAVQLKQKQTESMRVVAGQAVVVWDQIKTVTNAQTGGYAIDPYVYASLKQNCLRLEESLNKAVSLGLFQDLVGSQPHALQLHSSFRQSLAWNQSLDPMNSSPEDWTKMHLVMGMIRLFEQSQNFDSYLLPESVWKQLGIPQELKERAWTYLQNASDT